MAEKVQPENSSPENWRMVLHNYPKLKINFAHFGGQHEILGLLPRTKWQDIILEFIETYGNVYTDFSYRGCKKDYYADLRKVIDKVPGKEKLLKRLLFGSDFMINLLDIDSYDDYLAYFKGTGELLADEKYAFCSDNPGRFLF